MSRISALLVGTAVLTTLTAAPAAAWTEPVSTSAPYVLKTGGQVEGLSVTALPQTGGHAEFRAAEHHFGRTSLHEGWGVHLSAAAQAPGPRDTDVRAVGTIDETRAFAGAEVTLSLTDAQGPFLVFGRLSRSVSCGRDGAPDITTGVSGLTLWVRGANGALEKVTADSADAHGVDAGHLATPDGQQRTTKVERSTVTSVDDVKSYGNYFPVHYRKADAQRLLITQQLGDEIHTYDMLVGGVACDS